MNISFEGEGLTQLEKAFRGLLEYDIRIGYVGEDGSEIHFDSSISVAELAAIHEYGTDDIPQRSFIRSTMVDQLTAIQKIYSDTIQSIIMNDVAVLVAYENAGKEISKLVKDKLERANSWAEGLKESTLESKVDSQILKETGQLIENLGWGITKGDSIVRSGRAP